MIVEQLALVAATAFTAVAAYVNLVEQPARIDIAPPALLAQWTISYKRATVMQVTLVIAAGVFGLVAFAATHDGRWLVGALLMLAMLPYTFLVVLPTNRRLMAMTAATDRVRPEVERWARLHMGRTGLGLAAVIVFLWATL